MDDLLDLNFTSSAPTQNPRQPSTNSGLAFDSLSRAAGTPNYYGSASSQPSRSHTPQTAPIPQIARLGQPPRPSSGLGDRQASAAPTASRPSGDAFSSLLSLGPAGNGAESMAERARRLEKEKRDKEESEKRQFENGDFWDKFGESAVSAPAKSTAGSGIKAMGGFTGFDDLLQPSSGSAITRMNPTPAIIAPTPSVAPKSSKGTFWDMEADLLSTKPSNTSSSHSYSPQVTTSSSSRPPVPPVDPFDFDLLASSASNRATLKQGAPIGGGEEDDDFLGDLAQPVKPRPTSHTSHTPSARPPRVTARPSSPPPHVVGQIVEMGFSPAQARAALAKTPTGLDVTAALDLLLGASSSSRSNGDAMERNQLPEDEDEEEEDFIQRERSQREELERERRRARRAGPSRDAIAPRTKDEIRSAGTSGRGTPELGEQAEKYLAQASEIGTNVLSKATSFWAAGKEKAQKLYEEQKRVYEAQQAAKEGGQGREGRTREGVRDGRPRWMIDAEAGDVDGEEKEQGGGGGFRDDAEEEASRPKRGPRSNGVASGSTSMGPRPEEPYRSVRERADLLFADEPQPYIPASRRKATVVSPPPVVSARPSRSVTPIPPTLIQRQIISAPPTQIERAAAAKTKGNDHFKLGRFSESESSYSTAISSLPAGHLHLVALHNNRAAARLKLGQSDGAVEDCGAVLLIIGHSYHPSKEAPLSSEYADVRLPESMVKALIKRAQAYEMDEKWRKALEDWEKVMGLDSAFLGAGAGAQGTRNMAAEGARRAKKMLDGGEPTTPAQNGSTPHAVHKPATRPTSKAPSAPSTAVKELRQANLALEREDAERLRLKDSVEAKLGAWKSGKETNLRALIASLDLVLWEGIMGGVKVGMHELITEKQVKIRYMKVIARLHPDKLDVKSTTVEQRMLANGAFGTLNEAWQAFQNGS